MKNSRVHHILSRRIVEQIFQRCLIWLREEGLEEKEEMIIIIKAKHAPTLLKSQQSIIWQPGFSEKRSLKVSDWVDFETAHLVSNKQLKRMFKKYLPECEVRKGKREGVFVLEILWPMQLSYEIIKDIELANSNQKVSITQGILTLFTYHPDWITTGKSKKGELFRRKVPMGFEKQQIVIYEGDEGSYIFNQNGLRYLHAQTKEE
ncbi:MAG: hypothetical protein ACRC1P_01015, partial [Cellulosilyticaceae bacterium]